MCIANAGFSLEHKNVHFDPFLPQMTPKTVHRGAGRGDSVFHQNSQMFLFPEVNVPQFLDNEQMSLRSCQLRDTPNLFRPPDSIFLKNFS